MSERAGRRDEGADGGGAGGVARGNERPGAGGGPEEDRDPRAAKSDSVAGELDAGAAEVNGDDAPAQTEGGGESIGRRRPSPRGVADRVTLYIVRAVFFLVAAGLGIQGVRTFSVDPDASIVGGILSGCAVALGLIVLEAGFSRGPIRRIAAITFGLLMGLVLSAVFQHVVRMITSAVAPDMDAGSERSLLAYLNLLTTSIFCYFGVTLLLATKDDFKFIIPYVEFRREVKSGPPLVLDTSVFIDGRFQALLSTSVLDQRLEVPRFVLDELQGLADSADRSIRERGRRGLDILRDIEQNHWVEVVEYPLQTSEDVDVGLLRLASAHEGKIVTTDHNLTKRARVQGVPVVNINDLATALKPVLVPGETLRVRLLREGDEKGQAVGFLRDGTMVVVEQAASRIGMEVTVNVTSAIQTSAGKMVFGKLKRSKR